jgi:hypothetical protein
VEGGIQRSETARILSVTLLEVRGFGNVRSQEVPKNILEAGTAEHPEKEEKNSKSRNE